MGVLARARTLRCGYHAGWSGLGLPLGYVFRCNHEKRMRHELRESGSYMRRNDSITDKNLIQLFRTIGFDILSDDPKLFFTNLVMGYRLKGTSGGFKTAWANADAPFFRRLVDIIHPRILLCLGKDTFRCTLRALGLQRLPVIRNYNRFIESSENPVQIHLCDDETAFVFAFAHCGVMGTLNRNRGTNEKASLNKQIQDWAKIVPFLCVT